MDCGWLLSVSRPTLSRLAESLQPAAKSLKTLEMTPRQCPECGALLDDAGSVCAACLLADALNSQTEPTEFTPGGGRRQGVLDRVAGHELLELIARGGMGVVYRARQLEPRREVALKALPGAALLSPEMLQRFRMEAQTLARLEHPYILPVYECGEEDHTPFFTMKLATGGSLAPRVRRYAGDWRGSAELMAQVSEAVHFAHTRGVLHRDLKPANILFDEDGHPFVCDFGLAKLADEDSGLTRTLALMGTPNYMAPELVAGGKGTASVASDVWALGIILYELLTGQPPFKDESMAVVLRKVAEAEPPSLPPAVPRDLAVITMKALQRHPAQRYAGADALGADLQRWLRGDPILARPVGPGERLWLWARRRPAVAALLSLLVLLSALGVYLLVQKNRDLAASTAEARENLRLSRLAQARALRDSGRPGQRFLAEEQIRESLRLGESLDTRIEMAAALARLDLRLRHRVPLNTRFDPYYYSEMSPDFQLCAHSGKPGAGQCVLTEIPSGRVRGTFPAPGGTARFAFDRTGERVAALFSNGTIEIHSTGEPAKLLETLKGTSTRGQPTFSFLPDGGCVYIAPDGAVMRRASGGAEATVLIPSAPHKTLALALNAAGDRLAAVVMGGLHIWSAAGEKLTVRSLPYSFSTRNVVWHPAGNAVFLATDDVTNRNVVMLRLDEVPYTRTSGQSGNGFEKNPNPTVLAGFRDYIQRTAVDPAGRLTATIAHDGRLRLHDARNGQPVLAMSGCYGDMVAFGPDGTTLAVSLGLDELGIFEIVPSPVWHDFLAPPGLETVGGGTLATNPAGSHIFAAGNQKLNVWDAGTRLRMTSRQPDLVHSSMLLFDPRSADILYLGLTPVVEGTRWARLAPPYTADPAAAEHFAIGRSPMAITPDGRHWLVQEKLKISVCPEGKPDGAQDAGCSGECMALAPDGKRVAVSTREQRLELRAVGPLTVLDTAGPFDSVRGVRFSPDGTRLVLSTLDTHLIYHVRAGRMEEVARLPRERVLMASVSNLPHAVFSGDGSTLAILDSEDAVRLLTLPDLTTRLLLHPPHPLRATALLLNHDGTRLFLHGAGERLYEWNLAALRGEFSRAGLSW